MNFNACLTISGRRERLLLPGGNRRVAFNQLGHDATKGLDAKAERGHVQKQHVFNFTGQNGALNRSTDGHDFIRVHGAVRFTTEEFLDLLLN